MVSLGVNHSWVIFLWFDIESPLKMKSGYAPRMNKWPWLDLQFIARQLVLLVLHESYDQVFLSWSLRRRLPWMQHEWVRIFLVFAALHICSIGLIRPCRPEIIALNSAAILFSIVGGNAWHSPLHVKKSLFPRYSTMDHLPFTFTTGFIWWSPLRGLSQGWGASIICFWCGLVVIAMVSIFIIQSLFTSPIAECQLFPVLLPVLSPWKRV